MSEKTDLNENRALIIAAIIGVIGAIIAAFIGYRAVLDAVEKEDQLASTRVVRELTQQAPVPISEPTEIILLTEALEPTTTHTSIPTNVPLPTLIQADPQTSIMRSFSQISFCSSRPSESTGNSCNMPEQQLPAG